MSTRSHEKEGAKMLVRAGNSAPRKPGWSTAIAIIALGGAIAALFSVFARDQQLARGARTAGKGPSLEAAEQVTADSSIAIGPGDPSIPRDQSIRGIVRDMKDQPVPAAIVSAAFKDMSTQPRVHRVLARVRTEVDGSFILGPLDDRHYSVVAEADDHGLAIAENQRPGVHLELWLNAGVHIEGIVTARDRKTPLKGARVHVLGSGLGWIVETDSDGRYSVDAQPPVTRMIVVANGYRRADRSPLPIVLGRSHVFDFELTKGEALTGEVHDSRTGAPIAEAMVAEGFEDYDRRTLTDKEGRYTLEAVSAAPHRSFYAMATGYVAQERQTDGSGVLSFALEPGLMVGGRVLDPYDRPVSSASVYLHRVSESRGLILSADDRAPKTTADAEGRFRLSDVVPGTVCVVAIGPGYAPGESAIFAVDHDRPLGEEVVVRLERGMTVDVSVYDAHGHPLERATVTASGPQGGSDRRAPPYYWREHRPFRTDEQGRTRLEGLVPGTYTVSAWHPAYGATYARNVQGKAGESVPAALSFRGHQVTGRVVALGGEPVAGALVSAWGTTGVPHYGRSDGLGRFRIVGLPDGLFKVGTSSGLGGSEWLSVMVPAENVELKLMPHSTLRGVVETSEGHLREGFWISLLAKRGDGRVSSHAAVRVDDGTNRFEVTVSPGTYDVIVRAPPFRPAVVTDVVILPGLEAPEVRFLLAPGSTVHGVAYDRNATPLAHAWVSAVPQGMELHRHAQVRPVKTTHEGRFVLTEIVPGGYEFQLDGGRHGSSRTTTSVPPGNLALDLRLGPLGALVVRVTDGGMPVAGAYVTFSYAEGGARAGEPVETDARGLATSHALPADVALLVRALHRDHGRAELQITATTGVETEVHLELRD